MTESDNSPSLVTSPLRRRLTEVRIPPDVQHFFTDWSATLFLVAVVEAELPDTPGVLPVWAAVTRCCPRAELRILDPNQIGLLEQLVGGESELDLQSLELPALLIFDDEWVLQANWGPRPASAEPLLDEWLARHPEYEQLVAADEAGDESASLPLGELGEALQWEMRTWYNSGLDRDVAREMQALVAALSEAIEE